VLIMTMTWVTVALPHEDLRVWALTEPLGGLTVGGQYGRRLARSGDTCRLVLALGEPATR
jgi:hypothetical protein